MAMDIAELHDALHQRFWWLIERMKDVPPVRVYPCQTDSKGRGYFTVDTRGQRFTGATVEEAIDAAMRQAPLKQSRHSLKR